MELDKIVAVAFIPIGDVTEQRFEFIPEFCPLRNQIRRYAARVLAHFFETDNQLDESLGN